VVPLLRSVKSVIIICVHVTSKRRCLYRLRRYLPVGLVVTAVEGVAEVETLVSIPRWRWPSRISIVFIFRYSISVFVKFVSCGSYLLVIRGRRPIIGGEVLWL